MNADTTCCIIVVFSYNDLDLTKIDYENVGMLFRKMGYDVYKCTNFDREYCICKNLEDFLVFLMNVKFSNNNIFYFSGHSDNNGIKLPNRTYIQFDLLYNLLLLKTSVNSKLLVLMDCCVCKSRLKFTYNRYGFGINDINHIDPDVDIKIIYSCEGISSNNGSKLTDYICKNVDISYFLLVFHKYAEVYSSMIFSIHENILKN